MTGVPARPPGGGSGTAPETAFAIDGGFGQAVDPMPPFHGSGTDMAGTWPLHTFVELGAFPSAVPCARLHVRQVLWEWDLESLSDSTELIVSELVTNAVHASQGLTGSRYDGCWRPGTPPVRLWLHSNGTKVLIQVWDNSDHMPEPGGGQLEAEDGRGLLLVTCTSTDWGTQRLQWSSGKVVWATVTGRGVLPIRPGYSTEADSLDQ